MLFGIHPPTVEFQLTMLRLIQRNGQRWCELYACAAGERMAGMLREGVITMQTPDTSCPDQLRDDALESASRQTHDLIGDNQRLGEMAWRNQVEFMTDFQHALLVWQKATFTPRWIGQR